MVSVNHFGYELRRQLNEAAASGSNQLLVTSHDLCRAIRSGTRAAKRWNRKFVMTISLFRTGAGTEWRFVIGYRVSRLAI